MFINHALETNVGNQRNKETGPAVKVINILYCVAWSYKSTFDSIRRYVMSKNPGVIVTGSEYPAPMLNQYLATFLTYFQFGFVLFIMMGSQIFAYFGMEVPQICRKIEENRFMYGIGAFFIGNMIRNQLITTGAFEIFFDNELVFSKLQSNQIPSETILNDLFRHYKVF